MDFLIKKYSLNDSWFIVTSPNWFAIKRCIISNDSLRFWILACYWLLLNKIIWCVGSWTCHLECLSFRVRYKNTLKYWSLHNIGRCTIFCVILKYIYMIILWFFEKNITAGCENKSQHFFYKNYLCRTQSIKIYKIGHF